MSDRADHIPLHAETDDASVKDQFHRRKFAERLARAVATRPSRDPFIIGLSGSWGEGKSTVLSYMGAELQERFKHVTVVRFNPWMYPTQDDMMRGLHQAILHALENDPDPKAWQAYMAAFARYSGQLIKLGGDLSGAGVASVGGQALTNAADRLEGQSKTDPQLKARVETALRNSSAQLVIVIDDLDRLTHEEIRLVFRLIKAVYDLPALTYVLAYDPHIVAAALAQHYGTGQADSGYRFLEKIVQLSVQLPRPDELDIQDALITDLEATLHHHGITLTEDERRRMYHLTDEVLIKRLTTPREIKRLINAIAFAIPILRSETNPVEVMYVESLRLLYPELFDQVRENPIWFINPDAIDSYSTRVLLARALEQRPEGPKYRQRFQEKFGELDPLKLRLLGSMFPLFAQEMREYDLPPAVSFPVGNAAYFKRYFMHAIPSDDLPDSQVQLFLEALSTNHARATELLNSTSDQAKAMFIRKASNSLEGEETRVQQAMIHLLAGQLEEWSQQPPRLAQQPHAVAQTELRHLLERLPLKARQETLEEIIGHLPASVTLYHFHHFIGSLRNTPEVLDDLTPSGIALYHGQQEKGKAAAEQVTVSWARRIWEVRDELVNKKVVRPVNLAHDVQPHISHEQTSTWLLCLFEKQPESLDDYLSGLAPVETSSKRAAPHMVSKANVDYLGRVLKLHKFVDLVAARYPAAYPPTETENKASLALLVAQRFLHLYQQKLNPPTSESSTSDD